jgi:hypothetical protein
MPNHTVFCGVAEMMLLLPTNSHLCNQLALGRFCKVLECQPGDILEWQPDDIGDKIHLSSTNDEIGLTVLEEIEVKSDPPKRNKNQAHMIIIDANIHVA